MGAGERGRRGHRHGHRHHHRPAHRAHHAARHHHHHHHRRANRRRFWHQPQTVVAGSGASNVEPVPSVSCLAVCSFVMIVCGVMMCIPGAIFTAIHVLGSSFGVALLSLGFLLLITGIVMCYFTCARRKAQPNVTIVGDQPMQPGEIGLAPQPTVQAGVAPNQPPGTYPPQAYPPQGGQYVVYPPQPPPTGVYQGNVNYPGYPVTGNVNYPGYPVTGAPMQPPESMATVAGHGHPYDSQYGGFDRGGASDASAEPGAPPPSYDEVVNR